MLVIPDFGERFYVDFEDPTPADRDMQLKEFTAGYDKWLTKNEIREALNLEAVPNGDTLPDSTTPKPTAELPPQPEKVFRGKSGLQARFKMIEGIIADVKKGVKSPKKKAKESLLKSSEIRESYKAFINKKIDKRAEKFQKQVLAESEKQMERVLETVNTKSLTTKDFEFDKKSENQIFTEIALPFMKEAALEAGQEALDLVGLGESFSFTELLEKKLKERAKFFAKSVNDTTLEKLSRVLAEGIDAGEGITELTARVKGVYKEFPTYRAETIARTESTAVNNEGFLEAYKQSKVVNSMEWLSAKDSRVRPEHVDLDGDIVKVGEPFSNGLLFPSEPNCRCVLAPVI
jgi:SPP1 gp7 family putative phage head morphogenesis protein